jgi:hypothetical protein
MNDLEKKLDELFASKALQRKVSDTQTVECPIWSPIDAMWIESDAQLRERLREELKNRDKKRVGAP